MSSIVLVFLLVCAFAAGLGLGLVVALRPRAIRTTQYKAPPGEVYFGRSGTEEDHPDDIERQGSHLARPPNGLAYSGRSYEDRYAGMDERRIID